MFLAENKINSRQENEIFSIYHDPEYQERDVDVEIAIPVDRMQDNQEEFVFKELEAIPCAVTVISAGAYENIGVAIEATAKWIDENGYEIVDVMPIP